jgi:O-antigen ligase
VAYIIVVPVEKYVASLSNVLVFAIAIVIVGYLLFGGRLVFKRSQLSIIVLLSLFLIWYILSSVTAEFPVRHLSLAKTVALVLVVTVAGCIGISSQRRLHKIILTLVGLTVVIGSLTILHVITPLPFGMDFSPGRSIGPIYRTFGVRMKYATYGIMASIALPYLVITSIEPGIFSPKEWESSIRRGSFAGLLVIVGAIVIGQSRSTYISLMIIIGTLSFLLPVFVIQKKRPLHYVIQFAAPAILFAGVFTIITILIASVSFDVFDVEMVISNIGSIQARFEQYMLAVQAMINQPLFGVGARYIWAINSNHTVHNLWLLVGTWSGIPGFVIWILIFCILSIALFRRVLTSDRRLQTLQLVLLTSLLGTTVELAFWIGFRDILAVFLAITVGSLFLQDSVEESVETCDSSLLEKGN